MIERTIIAVVFVIALTAGGSLSAGASPVSAVTATPGKIGSSGAGLQLVHGRRHGRWMRGPHCVRAWHLAGVGTGIIGGAIAGVGIGAAMDGVGAGSGRMGCAAGSDSEHLPDCVVLRGLAGGPTCR